MRTWAGEEGDYDSGMCQHGHTIKEKHGQACQIRPQHAIIAALRGWKELKLDVVWPDGQERWIGIEPARVQAADRVKPRPTQVPEFHRDTEWLAPLMMQFGLTVRCDETDKTCRVYQDFYVDDGGAAGMYESPWVAYEHLMREVCAAIIEANQGKF